MTELAHRRGVLRLDRPAVMGVLNVTPDSFSDGGRFRSAEDAVAEALRMVERGADIIDVGGESTRPGAEVVPLEEELRRVVPVIEGIRRRSDVVVSIDTTKADVARRAVAAGADIVNDVSGATFEPEVLDVCARSGAGVIVMHTPGRPDEMDRLGAYDDIVDEVRAFLEQRVEAATAAGIPVERVAVDPGFGFGKDVDANYALLAGLDRIVALGRPVLVGVSRKRMIRGVVGSDPPAVEHATTAVGTAAILAGATLLRVHDVVAGKACSLAGAAIVSAMRGETV